MVDPGGAGAERSKLSIWQIVAESYQTSFKNFGAFARLSWLPFLVVVFATAVQQYIDRAIHSVSDEISAPVQVASIFVTEIFWLFTIPIATAWSRFLILGPDAPNARVAYEFGSTERVYLSRYICLYLVTIVVAVLPLWYIVDLVTDEDVNPSGHPFFDVSIVPLILVLAFTFWILCRFLIVLPAAAIGAASRFRDSLRLTSGHSVRIFAILLMTSLPEIIGSLALVLSFPDFVLSNQDGMVKAFTIGVVESAFPWLFFTLTVSALALIYKQLIAESQSEQNGAAP